MPIDVEEWLSSSRVQMMTAEEEGAFFRLCLIQWREGGLPADPWELLVLGRLVDRTAVQSGSPSVHVRLLDAFPMCPDGLRRNPKTVSVRARAELFLDSQRKKGLASGVARRAAAVATSRGEDTSNRGSTGFEPGSNRDEPPRPSPSPRPSHTPTPTPPTGGAAVSKGRKRNPTFDLAEALPVLADFPDLDTPRVRAALEMYLPARTRKHGSWTPQGMKLALRKFASLGPDVLAESIDRATERPWQTIFPPEANQNDSGSHSSGGGSDDHMMASELIKRQRADYAKYEMAVAAAAAAKGEANGRLRGS